MTRNPKTSDTQRTLNTQGAEDSLKGAQPDQAEAPQAVPQEQAAAPAAEGDPSAASHDAGETGPGDEDGPGDPVAEADDVTLLAVIAAIDPEATPPIMPEPTSIELMAGGVVTVICHRDGGRRRAGRRWPQGETTVPASDLLPYELAMLQGDPQFTVRVG